MLKLVLQPIVENAVFHGLRPLTDRKGKLSVSVRQLGKDLEIIVADNGVGMSKEKINSLLKPNYAGPGASQSSAAHIGVRNVHERVQLYYGPNYGLSIESEPAAGTTVKVRLKMIETGDGADGANRQIAAGR
ncbi:sensor histidine kinase [Paenibacillus sp. GCM10027626]|uniref:sensor histidine kinase n=1 Tax=Paenibacillus sp. GCM10027626 TaxID=3273411 RepID=UPI00363E48D1